MGNLVHAIMIGLVLAVVGSIGYGAYMIERKINYKLSYGAMVQQSIDKTMEEHINKYHKGEVE